jgi:hypothetical protein
MTVMQFSVANLMMFKLLKSLHSQKPLKEQKKDKQNKQKEPLKSFRNIVFT